jgi:hypothetical protein
MGDNRAVRRCGGAGVKQRSSSARRLPRGGDGAGDIARMAGRCLERWEG